MIELMLNGHVLDRVSSFSGKPLGKSKHVSIEMLVYQDLASWPNIFVDG